MYMILLAKHIFPHHRPSSQAQRSISQVLPLCCFVLFFPLLLEQRRGEGNSHLHIYLLQWWATVYCPCLREFLQLAFLLMFLLQDKSCGSIIVDQPEVASHGRWSLPPPPQPKDTVPEFLNIGWSCTFCRRCNQSRGKLSLRDPQF